MQGGFMRWRVYYAALSGTHCGAQFSSAQANNSAEQRTSRYMDSIRRQPPALLAFLRDMPKGGDLHNHLSGAVYAESFIDFAV